MNHSRTIAKAIPLLLSVGLALSACAPAPDYGMGAYPSAYNGYYDGYEGYPYGYAPVDGSLGFGFGGFDHFHHDRGFGHGLDEHHFAPHAGTGFARFGGHGFAALGGFGGHRG